MSEKQTKGGSETFLRIGTLQLGDGASVTVVGDQADGSGYLADNRVLIVQRLEATARPEWAPPSESEQRAVNLKGEATLILGTELAQGESVKDLRATYSIFLTRASQYRFIFQSDIDHGS